MNAILRASPDEAAEILALQKLAYQTEAQLYDDPNIPPLRQTLEELRDDFNRKFFLKAVQNDVIVGSVRASRDEQTVHIERLIVHPDYRGQGIGTALMREIETHFTGATRFELFTGHKSLRNIELYERLGYKRFKEERISSNLSFVYMEKRIL